MTRGSKIQAGQKGLRKEKREDGWSKKYIPAG